MDILKKIPEDIKQALYSLFVSVMLISGALLMLDGYLDSISPKEITVDASPEAEETECESSS